MGWYSCNPCKKSRFALQPFLWSPRIVRNDPLAPNLILLSPTNSSKKAHESNKNDHIGELNANRTQELLMRGKLILQCINIKFGEALELNYRNLFMVS